VTELAEAALTDDEIAALAYRHRKTWRAVLPTLDPDDAEDIARAVFRGDRSLIARGLLDPAGETPGALEGDLAALVATALDGEVWLSAFTSDRTLKFDPNGFTYLNYHRPGGQVLVEIVTAVGLHRFGMLTVPEADRALTDLVRGVFEGTASPAVEGAEVADTLCLALPTPQRSRERHLFAVRPGAVEEGHVDPTDLAEVDRETIPLRESTLDAAIDAIRSVYG
jgi:hypothetical protein